MKLTSSLGSHQSRRRRLVGHPPDPTKPIHVRNRCAGDHPELSKCGGRCPIYTGGMLALRVSLWRRGRRMHGENDEAGFGRATARHRDELTVVRKTVIVSSVGHSEMTEY